MPGPRSLWGYAWSQVRPGGCQVQPLEVTPLLEGTSLSPWKTPPPEGTPPCADTKWLPPKWIVHILLGYFLVY